MKSLVIAEKPSVARDIARVLHCTQKGNGILEGKEYVVTWALGHLVTLADPEEYDKKYMIFSAVTNLIMSIGAGKIGGVNGVVLGTIVGHLFIWYGRVKFVYRSYFNRHMTSYWLREVAKFILLFVEIELVEYFTKYVPRDGIRGFVLREFVVVAIIGLSSVAIFGGSKLFLRKTS